jgi:GT2 family glycosyltransferase
VRGLRARKAFAGNVDNRNHLYSTAIYPLRVSEFCTNALLAKSTPFDDFLSVELKGNNIKPLNDLIVRHHSIYTKTGIGRSGQAFFGDVPKLASSTPNAVLYCGVSANLSPIGDVLHRPTVAPLYTISVLCLNHWDLTEKCLNSIVEHSEHYELFVTNNGSTDETAVELEKWAKDRPQVRILTNRENLGFQAPNEHALTLANGRFFVLFNNDMEACRGWLEALRAPFERDPMMALTGIAGTCCRITDEFKGVNGDDLCPEYIEGGCLMTPVGLVRKHGLFSPYLKFIYWEDTDLSLRMREMGYRIATVPIGISHHHRSATTKLLDLTEVKKHNLLAMWERWRFYIKRRTFERRIQIVRRGARGDVLLVTPVIEALRKKWPQAKIAVQTAHPEMLVGVADCEQLEEADLTYDLDSAYERRPGLPIVDVFADRCGVKLDSHRPRMVASESDKAWALTVARGKQVALIHPGPTTWPGKNWSYEKFEEVVKWLQRNGYYCVSVGGNNSPHVGCDDSVAGVSTPQQLYALAGLSQLFVGLDSMPQHVASAANTPSVVLFGATDPKCIMRPETFFVAVQASRSKADCVGAHGRRTKAITFSECDGACMNAIEVNDVIIGVRRAEQ